MLAVEGIEVPGPCAVPGVTQGFWSMRKATFLQAATGLAVVLAASTAWAQPTSDEVSAVSVDISIVSGNISTDRDRFTINLEDCWDLAADSDDDVAITWTFGQTPATDARYSIKVQASEETCNTSSLTRESGDECDTLVQQETLSGTSLGYTLSFGAITGVTAASECDDRADTHDVIAIFTSFNAASDDNAEDTDSDGIRFEFDTDRPTAPTGISAKAGESSITVDWSAVEDAESYHVYYSTDEILVGDAPEGLSSSDTTTTVGRTLDSGITRDQTYYIGVTVEDEVGNESLISEVVTATTQPVTDFYEYYRSQGGADEGGYCSTANPTSGGLWGLALVLGMIGIGGRRRRTGLLAVTLAATGVLAAAPQAAEAQVESAIHGGIAIKFGSYEPTIDEAFSGTGPVETVFGSGGSLMVEGEYAHYLWRNFGSLAVGFSVGYTKQSGKGLLASGEESVDDTSLALVPMRLSAIYYFDVLTRDFGVPLVPYLNAGFDYTFWWVKSAAGIATYRDPDTNQLDEGRGGTFGWHVGAGVRFLLDFLATRMSRGLDATAGINNSYIFAEWLMAEVDDFGSDTSIQLSDSTVLFGLAFEF